MWPAPVKYGAPCIGPKGLIRHSSVDPIPVGFTHDSLESDDIFKTACACFVLLIPKLS
jgi:hypothetical protein